MRTNLARHVPPIALDWDQTCDRQWQAVTGTLVFADIAGFTALTERMSRLGRIGAEEIVETLNRVFTTILDLSAGRGGQLLKFGGDALLFLFLGPEHLQQACDATVEMRAAVRSAASWRTRVGRLGLSISIGLHSGTVDLFHVGEPTRELFVIGPAIRASLAAEKAAQAGQVVLSPHTAPALPPGQTRARADGALLLRRRQVRTAPVGRSAVTQDWARARDLFPVDLGEYLGPAVPEPEHRNACIAFARMSGTDGLLAQAGPAATADALHQSVAVMERELLAEAVTMLATDVDVDGAKFFLASGVPRASEDDEGRMLRALRRVADADTPLPMSFGVNRGHVFVAEVGLVDRGAYAAMGDTTNTAARIMSKAPNGVIFAHPAVLDRSRTLFATKPAGPFTMKGKAEPLTVYEVGQEAGTRSRVGADELPWVGREAELDALVTALESAGQGTGAVVTITGPTGSGKSRLLRTGLARMPALPTLLLRAEPYGAASAYRLFRDPLRALLGIERDTPRTMGRQLVSQLESKAPTLGEWAPLLADLLTVEVPSTPAVAALDPQFRPERLADVLVELLTVLIPGPLMIIAEEAHWADGASVRLLDRLALASSTRAWAVVAVRRGTDGGFLPAGIRIELGPLPREDVQRLVLAATGAANLRPHEVEALVERADGNPLFVAELARVARTSGSVADLPESVSDALSAQIDMLHPGSRRILAYCSVLGRSFRREVLDQTLRADGLGVDPATRADLDSFLIAQGPDRLRFRNGLVRDAAYESMAFRTRAARHHSAGLTLEKLSTDRRADAPMHSLHFWRAGDAARAFRYSLLAGEAARAAWANSDAAVYYERALDTARSLTAVTQEQRAEIWAAIGQLRELAGMLPESISAYRHAAQLQADPVDRAEVLVGVARVQERAGRYTAALRSVNAGRKLLRGIPGPATSRVAVRLDNLTALVRLGQEQPREAHRWARRAAEGAADCNDPETLVQALMAIDFAQAQLGMPELGAATERALEICRTHGYRPRESVALANLGAFAFYAGRWVQAVRWLRSSREVAMAAGNAFGAAETDLSLADILIWQGRLDSAESVLTDAIRVLQASGMGFAEAYGQLLLARIHTARGDAEQGLALSSAVARRFLELGHPDSALEASLEAAQATIASGAPARALEIVAGAEQASRGEVASLTPRVCLVRARALRQLGRVDQAGDQVAAGLAAAQAQNLPLDQGLLLAERSALTGSSQDAESSRQILAALGINVSGG